MSAEPAGTGGGADERGGLAASTRAMVLAAGLGTRMRPLSELRAKPALSVRGRPLISLLLAFLARHGVRDVTINLHHLPQTIRDAVDRDCPPGARIHWSEESAALGTGGGLRRAADFLGESPECVVLAGDMLLDLDLPGLLARHRDSGRDATLVLREDPRADRFGTIGIDAEGHVTRIGARRTTANDGAAGPEARAGLFTGVRIFSRPLLAGWPERAVFEDLRDWLVPAIEQRGAKVYGELLASDHCVWEPVGTPAEYLRANLDPPCLPSLGGSPEHWSGEIQIVGDRRDVVLERRATLGPGARLSDAVVWEDERVPAGLHADRGVFAGGRFHPVAAAGATEEAT